MWNKIQKIYVGSKQVRPTARTISITRTEQSDMSQSFTYWDDASGRTAWDTRFDEFFGYYACKLNTDWVETAKVTQQESWWAWKLDLTRLWTLTGWDNIMIAFPVLWIKMTKSGSTVTLSITDDTDRASEGYQYYAHSTGTIDSPWTPKSAMYLGAFKWTFATGTSISTSWSVLKSWATNSRTENASPAANQTQATFCSRAKANNTSLWWNISWWYQRQFVNALYMMKYWNPDSQSKVGAGYTWWSQSIAPWGTASQTDATYWTTSSTAQIRLFGLEDWWWNVYEWVGGMYTDSSKVLYTQLSWYSGALSGGTSTLTTIQHSWSYYCMSAVAGNNKAMFAPTATVNNSSYNTYYCDFARVSASCLAGAGGRWDGGSGAGAFRLSVSLSAGDAYSYIGARLMFL